MSSSDIRRVSPAEGKALVDAGYTHVDVRTVTEFETEHPAGAHNVPFLVEAPAGQVPNADFLAVMKANYPRDAKLLIGCRTGNRSLRAARALAAEGYTDLVDQRAGMDGARDPFGRVTEPGWKPTGLPTETGDGGEHSYEKIAARR